MLIWNIINMYDIIIWMMMNIQTIYQIVGISK